MRCLHLRRSRRRERERGARICSGGVRRGRRCRIGRHVCPRMLRAVVGKWVRIGLRRWRLLEAQRARTVLHSVSFSDEVRAYLSDLRVVIAALFIGRELVIGYELGLLERSIPLSALVSCKMIYLTLAILRSLWQYRDILTLRRWETGE